MVFFFRPALKNQIKKLIALGSTREAIILIYEKTKTRNKRSKKEIIRIANQYVSNTTMYKLNAISHELYVERNNKINNLILDTFVFDGIRRKIKWIDLVNIQNIRHENKDYFEITLKNNANEKILLENVSIKSTIPTKTFIEKYVPKSSKGGLFATIGGLIGLVVGTIIAAPLIPVLPVLGVTFSVNLAFLLAGAGGGALLEALSSTEKSIIIEGESTSSIDKVTRKTLCTFSKIGENINYEIIIPCHFIIEEEEVFFLRLLMTPTNQKGSMKYEMIDKLHFSNETQISLFSELGIFSFSEDEIIGLEKIKKII